MERVSRGDDAARDRVVQAVYGELRMLARQRLASGPAISLQATELVHETFGRLFGREVLSWEGRRHFFGIASRAMQDVVIDWARKNAAAKRGGDVQKIPLSEAADAPGEDPERLLVLARALDSLEEQDPMAAEVVRLRYFVGLTGQESAEALGVSASTVDRRWAFARAWLLRRLSDDPGTIAP